ncbi:UBX domain-containing protein 11 isoform X2 [Spea bombifrons]|nr:UBX domain-containing protein 11 isoform X2 [Spea bombifrons]
MKHQDNGSSAMVKRSVHDSVPSDFDLLRTTMKRVSELERCMRAQEKDIQQKDQHIANLEQKIKRLQRHRTESPTQLTQELEMKCQKLQKRVYEMERFLGDYGLVWIGDDDSPNRSVQTTKTWNPGHALATYEPDFDLIIQNLRDLNILGGEGECHIEYREGGARLRSPEPVPLTLYKNGIIMFKGPFRSYRETTTQQCLKDIMDGYFPSELQQRFPDGVPFQVTDKRNVVFRERSFWDEFSEPGQIVGSKNSGVQETNKLPGQQLSLDRFLSKLPKAVVREGQVLDIRGPIEELLQTSGTRNKLKEIMLDSPLVGAEEKGCKGSPLAVCTLRIKSENGEHTYVVRMLPSETLGDLRTYLSHCRTSQTSSYDVIRRFPHCVYTDNSCTLQELGLVPNAFLLLRARSFVAPGAQETKSTNAYTQA